MKTTDMFLSAEERKFGEENTPIILVTQKMPQGQVLSPHIISLRGSTGARKLNTTGVQKKISEKLIQTPEIKPTKKTEHLFTQPEEDTVLSSIEEMFRGKNARVTFQDKTFISDSIPKSQIYKIPSQQEQFQKIRSEKKGILSSWFNNF